MKRLIRSIAFFILFSLSAVLVAQENELTGKNKNLEELRNRLQTREDIVENLWDIVVKTMLDEKVSKENKIEMVKRFISDFPDNNKYLKDAELMLFELKDGGADLKHVLNRKSYRKKIEWFAINFAGGNYGFGGGFTLITLRTEIGFWEVLRLQAVGIDGLKNYSGRVSANVKTMFGVPFFIGSMSRYEIRISTGFSGGYNTRWEGTEQDFDFLGSSNFNIPFEVSYLVHIRSNFAFQIGTVLDLPVIYRGSYSPIINGFIGFRI
jgi:hypothetical protein